MRPPQLVALLLFGTAATLSAQNSALARLNGRVPPDVARTVAALADSVAHAGLPAEPLLRKALEGGSKGVTGERIVAAVRTVGTQLGEAATALRASGITLDSEAVEAGGYAINAGLAPAEVADLAHTPHAPGALAGSLRSAGTLVALGVPAAQAVALVEAWVESGKPASQVLQLPELLQAAMAHGATPAQAAAGMTRGGGGPPADRPSAPPQSQGQGQGQGHPRRP